MSLEAVLQVLVAACAVYLGLVYASYLWLMAVGLWENRRRVREHTIEFLGLRERAAHRDANRAVVGAAGPNRSQCDIAKLFGRVKDD